MRRSGDIGEHLARIEETMATRDDVAGLRAEIARLRRSPWRWLGGLVFVAVLVVGFTALVLVFAVRPGIVP